MKKINILLLVVLSLGLSCSNTNNNTGETTEETTEDEEPPIESSAKWLEGSWGATFPVFGGERLDTEVANGYSLKAGAQQLVDELPSIGHIITNLSYFANSHYFPISKNSNVDIASEIDASMIPSSENDEIIFDVLNIFKNADKKIILYISTNYLDRAADDVKEAWVSYYTNNFGGDEYAAYEYLIKGFVEEVKDYADAYWLDTTDRLASDGKLDDFVNMIKEVDSTAAVSANYQKNYFRDESGNEIYVDSDGINDPDNTDYRIVLHEPLNDLQDFTNGHVTPLGQGAPPNSFAYEEYTIPNMVANPWFNYEGKDVLKHAWFPIRERWHSPRQNIAFETEQAYRFVKQIIEDGGAITYANTINYTGSGAGFMMPDEMTIMKEINDRLLSDPVPDYEPYVRPVGASLVGE